MNPAANVRAVETLPDGHAPLAEFPTETQDALPACQLERRLAVRERRIHGLEAYLQQSPPSVVRSPLSNPTDSDQPPAEPQATDRDTGPRTTDHGPKP